jgi:hypothetical protein
MKRLEPEIEREVRRLAAKGHKLREIGRLLGCSRSRSDEHVATRAAAAQPDGVGPFTGAAVTSRA